MPVFVHRISGNLAAGDVWNCVLHSQSPFPMGSVHTAVLDAVTTFLNDTIKPLWNSHTSSALFTTTELESSGLFGIAQQSDPLVVVGTGTGASVAQGTALVVGWQTPLPRRQGRGRIFLPSPDDGHITAEGLYVQAMCQTVADAAKAMIAAVNPNTQLVLYNKPLNQSTIITGARVNTKPSFQRRRNNKVDNNYQVGV